MTSFTIKIKTVSSTALGSGEGRAGVIDRDISHDEHGLPYIGGRRLKGLLRESTLEVHETLAHFPQWRQHHLLDTEELYGRPGQTQPSRLRLDDGRLAQHAQVAEWLAYFRQVKDARPFFEKEAVLSNYTELRTQTAMDHETGSAREDTLRVSRVLQPSVEFTTMGVLDTSDLAWKTKAFMTLWLACENLRRVGLSRNRGLGRVAISLVSDTIPFSTNPAALLASLQRSVEVSA